VGKIWKYLSGKSFSYALGRLAKTLRREHRNPSPFVRGLAIFSGKLPSLHETALKRRRGYIGVLMKTQINSLMAHLGRKYIGK